MTKEFILLAAKEEQKAYKKYVDLGTTEYALTRNVYNDQEWQFLSIVGTNELRDWALNILLWSKDGVKICSYWAADEIYTAIRVDLHPDYPLCVQGHSKAGPTAVQYMLKYGADRCIAYCPPPAFRRSASAVKNYIDNTLLIIDPDDPVPKLGSVSFSQPNTEIYTLPNDVIGLSVSDHSMSNIIDHFST